MASVNLPLVTMGDDSRFGILTGIWDSEFPFKVATTPGRDLPAETGLSGIVVLRFGGVSRGKSGGTTGLGGGRARGLGELGRDGGAELRPFNEIRPDEVEVPVIGDGDGAELRRVGVEGRESGLADGTDGECKLAGKCGLEEGVEGLKLCEALLLSAIELVLVVRTLDGVEDPNVVGRDEGVEGLVADEERGMGEDGLVEDETEAELVLRIEEDLFEE